MLGAHTVLSHRARTNLAPPAVHQNGRIEIIPNNLGERATPSLSGSCGVDALLDRASDERSTPIDLQSWLSPVISRGNRTPPGPSGGEPVAPPGGCDQLPPGAVAAFLFEHIRHAAEAYLGTRIESAVLAVPAHLSDAQRLVLRQAGDAAGLVIQRIMNAPVATILALQLDQRQGPERTAVVIDCGGRSLSVTALAIVYCVTEVLGTHVSALGPRAEPQCVAGDAANDVTLCGEALDNRLVNLISGRRASRGGIDVSRSESFTATDPHACAEIRREAERARRSLSTLSRTRLEACFGRKYNRVSEELTRSEFEELCDDLFGSLPGTLDRLLVATGLVRSDIDEVVLVGGLARTPRIREIVRDVFGREPFDSAALGIDPDEAVVSGAAALGGILSGAAGQVNEFAPFVLVELSLRVVIDGGGTILVLPRNSMIPTSRKRFVFSTAHDEQSAVAIRMVEGECASARLCHPVGELVIEGIPPAPRGMPEIVVTIEIDVNGVLEVRRGKTTGKSAASSF